MWFSVALMKFHLSGINWHVFNQSECLNCCLYIIIQKIAPQAKSGKYFQIWIFPRLAGGRGGGEWWRPEHAQASYPGPFFRPPGFSPHMGGKKGEFRDWTSNCYIAGVFPHHSAPNYWLVHGHVTSNNETVSRQMPWAGNIGKLWR